MSALFSCSFLNYEQDDWSSSSTSGPRGDFKDGNQLLREVEEKDRMQRPRQRDGQEK